MIVVLAVIVCFFYKGVFGGLVAEIRGGEVVAEFDVLVFESRGFVNASVLCVGNLELVVLKHYKVVFEALRGSLLSLVLVVEVFKFSNGDRTAVYRHKHGVGLYCGRKRKH